MKPTFVTKSKSHRSLTIRVPVAGKRVLYLIIVLDLSGSMNENGKIQSVQYSVEASLRGIRKILQSKEGIDAQLLVIAFGEREEVILGPEPIEKAELPDLKAIHQTTLAGPAIELLNKKLEELHKGRQYLKPVVILISDGLAFDPQRWQQEIGKLLASKWGGRRAIRIGVGVSGVEGDCDLALLKAFMNDPERQPLVAADAAQLGEYIEFALTSSFQQSSQIEPVEEQMQFPLLPSLPLEDEDDEEEAK